jgi:hypothetical protein
MVLSLNLNDSVASFSVYSKRSKSVVLVQKGLAGPMAEVPWVTQVLDYYARDTENM